MVFKAFFARQKPVSIMAKPMCINITTIAASSSQITPVTGTEALTGDGAAEGRFTSAASAQMQPAMHPLIAAQQTSHRRNERNPGMIVQSGYLEREGSGKRRSQLSLSKRLIALKSDGKPSHSKKAGTPLLFDVAFRAEFDRRGEPGTLLQGSPRLTPEARQTAVSPPTWQPPPCQPAWPPGPPFLSSYWQKRSRLRRRFPIPPQCQAPRTAPRSSFPRP